MPLRLSARGAGVLTSRSGGSDGGVARTMPKQWEHKAQRELLRRRARRRLAAFYVVIGAVVAGVAAFTVAAAR